MRLMPSMWADEAAAARLCATRWYVGFELMVDQDGMRNCARLGTSECRRMGPVGTGGRPVRASLGRGDGTESARGCAVRMDAVDDAAAAATARGVVARALAVAPPAGGE